MDTRHRVYYLVNLNQNHAKQGWWSRGWDSYGIRYRYNLMKLQHRVDSLKIRPINDKNRSTLNYYQMMISCKKEENVYLVNLLDRLTDVNYVRLERL